MTDIGTSPPGSALAHEPAVPGWPPRPPAALLRRSRLERRRRRWLRRLQQERPALHDRIVAVQHRGRRVVEAVLPRQRILPVTIAVLVLTLFDAVATWVLVGIGVAEEANPLLAGLIDELGLAVAMVLRVLVGGGLTVVLAWLATWRREARPVLVLVAVLLTAVAVLHVAGLVWTFT